MTRPILLLAAIAALSGCEAKADIPPPTTVGVPDNRIAADACGNDTPGCPLVVRCTSGCWRPVLETLDETLGPDGTRTVEKITWRCEALDGSHGELAIDHPTKEQQAVRYVCDMDIMPIPEPKS